MANIAETYLAIDFGGGSGRVIAGLLAPGASLRLEEVHRFANRPVRLGDTLYWDFPALFADMLEGLRKAAARYGRSIVSLGIDTWGVDFGFLDRAGRLVGNPVCYRDIHTTGMASEWPTTADIAKHYSIIGIQPLDFNSLYRLKSMIAGNDPKLEIADKLLFMPDLFAYFLTGEVSCEYTIASTSQMVNATTRQWHWPLIDSMGLSHSLFPPIVMPGESKGTISKAIAEATGLTTAVKVIAVGSHDTQSAAFASGADYDADNSAFLSSGTWSLLGVQTRRPILSEAARIKGFSNEGGVDGKICLLQNIPGLWVLQRLVDNWKSEDPTVDYPTLIAEAENSDCRSTIDVDHPDFTSADGVDETIRAHCRMTGQPEPSCRGDLVRVILESLALRYKKGVAELNRLLPKPLKSLIIIGGGVKNRLLNRLTAEATGLDVIEGAAEATAIGNIAVQAKARNHSIENII